MTPEVPPPDVPAGWYPDPDQVETQRFWDGNQWTEQRAPRIEANPKSWMDSDGKLTDTGRFGIGLILAGMGAVIAIVGVFLPMADTESNLHIAKNSLIQHWEGGVIIGVALAGFLSAFGRMTRPLTFLAGGLLFGIAIWAGADPPVEYRNRLSEVVAGDASPGTGIWAVGVGGILLFISAPFVDWKASFASSGAPPKQTPGPESEGPRPRMQKWEELMSGKPQQDDSGVELAEESEQNPDHF